MAEGLKYYQKNNQYPLLPSGEETLTHVLNTCKNTSDGKFKALQYCDIANSQPPQKVAFLCLNFEVSHVWKKSNF